VSSRLRGWLLFGLIAPNLEKAPPELIPRFHAATADYIAVQLRGVEFPAKENDDRIIDAYERRATRAGVSRESRSSAMRRASFGSAACRTPSRS
jgi:hypothetical protein